MEVEKGRADRAPSGTPYACFVCGYDTRHPIDPKEKAGSGVGEYVQGIGVRHKTTADCMTLINRFMFNRERYEPKIPPTYEGDETVE